MKSLNLMHVLFFFIFFNEFDSNISKVKYNPYYFRNLHMIIFISNN